MASLLSVLALSSRHCSKRNRVYVTVGRSSLCRSHAATVPIESAAVGRAHLVRDVYDGRRRSIWPWAAPAFCDWGGSVGAEARA